MKISSIKEALTNSGFRNTLFLVRFRLRSLISELRNFRSNVFRIFYVYSITMVFFSENAILQSLGSGEYEI